MTRRLRAHRYETVIASRAVGVRSPGGAAWHWLARA
jgi:hypothetical protein